MYRRLSGEMSLEELEAFTQLLNTDEAVAEEWRIFLAEQYLDGNIPPEEYVSFEKEIPGLAEETARQEEIRMLLPLAVQDKLRVELKEILPQETQEESAPLRKPLFQRSWVYAVAAAVIILIALPFMLRDSGEALTGEEVFAQHFEQMDMRMTVRGEDSDSIKLKIQQLYKSNQYEASLPLLQQLAQQEPTNPTYNLYLAICYLGLNPPNSRDAIQLLVPLQDDFNFGQASQWYLALAYFLDDKMEKGTTLAQKIAEQQGHSYRTQASKLLESLE